MNKKQWVILLIIIIIIYNSWTDNKSNEAVDSAPIGKFSAQSSYKNITAMKHDIFKQMTLDIFPFILVNSMFSKDFVSIDNFENSIIGRTILSAIAYAIYYQIIQPKLINRLPIF